MLCLTLPTFSLSYWSYCKFLKGNPVEYLTRDFKPLIRHYISRVSLATLKPLVKSHISGKYYSRL